jgi:hypothetical protein
VNRHNKFEGDSSLTRNDYYSQLMFRFSFLYYSNLRWFHVTPRCCPFLLLSASNGNNFEFNGTLYKHMQDYAKQYGNGNYDFNVMAAYRGARYNESRAENGRPKLSCYVQVSVTDQ